MRADKEKLLNLLKKKQGKPVEIKTLKRQLGKVLDSLLEELQLSGEIVRTRRNYYAYAPLTRYIIGPIRVRNKRAEVRSEKGTLSIPIKKTLGALDGDIVVSLPERGEFGRVVKILKRKSEQIPGFLVKEGKTVLFRPYRRNLPDFHPRNADELPSDGKSAFLGTIVFFPTPARSGRVRIEESLGSFGDREMETKVLYADRNWKLDFPEEVIDGAEEAAKSLQDINLAGRRDLRDEEIFTIDGEYARDFDDAISLDKIGDNKFRLGVHIADVSHFVRRGTALDHEAYARATSTYFPDRVIPMLPETLSNGVCSLVPDEDRLTMSIFMNVDGEGRTSRPKVEATIIRSKYRMTYDKVQEILEGKSSHPLEGKLKLMNQMARALNKKRIRLGSLDFDLPSIRIIFDAKGNMVGVQPEIRQDSQRLIEEFMIVANREVAKLLAFKKIPTLYRTHEPPDRGKLMELKVILEGLGYPFKLNLDEITPLQVQKLMESWSDHPESSYLDELTLRSLARARYVPDNDGHFGLALEYYCHFTSPIRRYPDLIVHRKLKELIEGVRYDETASEKALSEMDEAGNHCSKREWEAEDAEREVMEWKTLQLVKEREGDILDGRVSGVIETGIFILLPEYQVQGFIPFSTYKKDYLTASTMRQEVSGRRTSLSIKLGDELKVKVVSVDIHKRFLRLEI